MEKDNRLEIAIQRDYKVVKANEIIQKARYDLNITELKAFAYIVSKIKPNDNESTTYTFSIKDYCQVCGLNYKSGGNYRYVKETLKNLRDKSFWMSDETGRQFTVGWLEKAIIDKRSGKIEVILDKDIQKYVLGLFNNYTQYSLLSTLPMKSSYSFRIYELLKSYAFTNSHTFDIDDLKAKLAATNYVNFKDFRRKVIEVAVREINEYTDIEVSWEPVTKGRKVIQVRFDIKQRDSWGIYTAGQRAVKELDGQMTIEDYFGGK